MTVEARAPITTPINGSRRPVRVDVHQAELVGTFMDLETLATEAITANGASLQAVLRLPPGPWRDEMQLGHHATHDRLVRLLNEARLAAGRYDGRPDRGA